jgi:GT2 family glycosyltransferase
LAALRSQTSPVDEIVVVDNGSTDGTVDWLRLQADVTLIANATNRGFAAANNQGFTRSSGAHVLLLNPDVELGREYIERCLQHFDRPEVGSVTGKLLRAAPEGIIDSTGHNVYRVGWAENRGEELPDRGYDGAEEVFGVCAAAAVYRRQALESAVVDGELLDESYFSYIEDVDLDWRLRWFGWQAWYEPTALARHHRSASGGRFSTPIMRHILKNRVLTVVKNYDARSLWLNLPGVTAFTLVKTVDFARTDPRAALGLVDAARLMRPALRRRRLVRAGRRASPAQVSRWLQPFPWLDRIRRRTRKPTGTVPGSPRARQDS